jgi:hypothetical protein
MLELGPRGRLLACAIFFGSEAVLIATAGMRTDHSYGFRMFPESSFVVVHLSRRLDDGRLVAVGKNGHWDAHDCAGTSHPFDWGKMVLWPATSKLDANFGAPYGIENQVQRTRDAMQWVADHTPDDCETRAFVATVDAHRNGRTPYPIELEVIRRDR